MLNLNSLVAQLARRYPRDFTLITRTARARASYLAALPSTRAIETRLLPSSLAPTLVALPSMSLIPSAPLKLLLPLTRSYPRRFTFYVADPLSSIASRGYRRVIR